jgi:hypothetical protein
METCPYNKCDYYILIELFMRVAEGSYPYGCYIS